MLVNIKEASKLAGISRTNFYKNYINTGRVSISKDEKNRPMVDTSELLRVFGKLHSEHDGNTQGDTEKTEITPSHTQSDHTTQLSQLQAENDQLKERLRETRETLQKSEDRENWQRGQMEKMMETIKLLEAPHPAPSASFFARLFGKLK